MTSTDKQRSLVYFSLLVATFLVAGFAHPQLAHVKTLRHASQDEHSSLDPHAVNLTTTSRLLAQVYKGLVGRDKNFQIVPWLATSWSQVDAKTWRFKLRADVKFHDGSVMTADDVVFSVARALAANSQFKIALQGVASAKKIGNLTVDLILKEANPALFSHLFLLRIVSRDWAIKNNAKEPQNFKDKEDTFASRNTNGTVPFMVKERVPDVKTVLVEHKAWWNRNSAEKGNITEAIILPIKSNSARMAGLLSGDVDFVLDAPIQDVARLRNSPDLAVIGGTEARVQFIGFDQFRDDLLYSNVKGKNPFKDLRLRKAVSHAIDVETIKSKVMRNLANPVSTLITNDVTGYNQTGDKRLAFSPEKAKALLTEAGYPNGFEVSLDCSNVQPAAEVCLTITPMLARVGIKANPNLINQASSLPKLQKFDTSLFVMGWGTPTFDALYSMQAALRSYTGDATGRTTVSGGDGNFGRYSNAKVDALTITMNDVAILPLHQALVPWVMRKNITAVYAPNQIAYLFRMNIK